MSEHTQEPWKQAGASISAKGAGHIAKTLEIYMDKQTRLANAKRIVMCVNACAGMPDMQPGSVRKMLMLLKVAKCPSCDGSGAIPHGPMPDGSWEAEQCQWCYERDEALRELGEEV